MNIEALLEHIRFYRTTSSIRSLKVEGISMDSRVTSPGDLFICIRGIKADGHRFASQAVARGAVAIVAEEMIQTKVPVILVNDTSRALAMIASAFYRFPTNKLQLIGITGTNGKTSVSYLVDELFRLNKSKTGIIGTIQVKIADETIPIRHTTPDALHLQGYFSQMIGKQVDTAIMEVSSHALDQGRVYGCDFDVAVFTNLTRDHLDYHDNFDDYFRAKSLLFSQLGNGYNRERSKYAVVNRDCPYSKKLIQSTSQTLLTYGIEQQADVMAHQIICLETGTSFQLETPVGKIEVHSPLMGRFSIYNMLAAASVAVLYDIPLSIIRDCFEQTSGVRGRFEPVKQGQDFGVVVDYAHTPDSLKNVLKTIKQFCQGKVRVVFGCGGDRDRKKRPMMADVAMQWADHIIFTMDNPRTEDPEQIFLDMSAHIEAGYEWIPDRKKAIKHAIMEAEKGDMVLIAGKGHETYQEINGVRTHFDDREVAREILKSVKENS
ncbi:UDP-N-acetylmuramoyl-L-alanyl-D-glutamate--2,6-diaminopimelate ligase [Halobacillus locisalis]|uniref:UDP-N-acetylmuramoyl-L-alanyl-D-glutamate--2,6-diaminopimelate ligase n=1 Tax=Halobacillus locisalis TaxID=220753 RepID=A0A838CQW2_9BACI|nr:UDP-N-acetylmuramoyl-L-alanyl-D-glutamate--2,6-diaminopimelate ligase [Halobacillus locisalis]MBA2174268.1 UDP-N-acetylmuramoyl-L-alanyl-D-glutamate--2,6-diaminopimelate ligase [Halobacillus locisalis]